MTIITPAGSRSGPHASAAPLGPQLLFAATIFAALAAISLSGVWMPRDLMLGAVSASLFGLAGFIGLAAWRRPTFRSPQLSYLNVAGAFILIGICIAALIEAEELVRLIDGLHT
jgi:hypothetical protein